MPRTAPVPNMLPIPGMDPGSWVMAGGGDGGGAGGKGAKGGGGKKGAGGGDGDSDAEGGGKSGKGGEGCGDPVCPITGKMFLEVYDFGFWALKPLRFIRHYSSRRSDIAGSFGHGWTHPLGWRLEVRRRRILVFDERGDCQKFQHPVNSTIPSFHPFGWQLFRFSDSYRLNKPDGESLTFQRHPRTQTYVLVSIADPHGNATQVHYDERGFLCGMTDSEGRPFVATLDRQGRVVRFRVPADSTRQTWLDLAEYRYDEAGDLVEFIDAERFSWRYRYENHLMVEHRTAGGLSYLYRYDGTTKDAYCIESWGEYVGRDDPALLEPISRLRADPLRVGPRPKGINYVRFTYDKEEHSSEVENGLGGITRYFGDASGRVVKKVSPSGTITERAFEGPTGAVSPQAGSDSPPPKPILDGHGVPSGFVRADGTCVEHVVTEPLVRETVDTATGARTTTHYDQYAQPLFRRLPDGTSEAFEYDERGRMTAYVDRSGGRTSYAWDSMSNLVEVRTPAGQVERRSFDYLGRCIEFVSTAGEVTAFRYDGRSETVYKRTHNGTEAHAVYDANRKITSLRIGHRAYQYEYGGLDWLIRWRGPDGGTTEFRYDVEGRVIWVRNARGQEYRITRDIEGRIIRVVDFEGLIEERQYDSGGNVRALSNVLGKSTRTYDPAGRLAAVETPDDSVGLKYAASGANVEITNAAIKLAHERDALGRVTLDQQGGHQTEVTWRNGRLEDVISDVGVPLTHSIGFGALNLLQAGSTTLQFIFPRAAESVSFLGKRLVRRDQYDLMGNRIRTVVARYDARAGLAEPAIAQPEGPDQLLLIEYGYNEHCELVQERRSDGRVVDFVLDGAGRIQEKYVSRHGQLIRRETLRYDAVGTPLLPGVRFDAQMRPTALNGETFEYDLAGRMIRRVTDRGVWEYEWDFLGNLIGASGPDRDVKLVYDARGRRQGKQVLNKDGSLVKEWSYVWSNQTILHEVDHTTGWARTYLRKPAEWQPFGHIDSRGDEERPSYYVSDRTGAPDLALDDGGAVVWSAERTVFGHVEPDPASSVDVRVRFAGQHYDEDLGLVYNRMRWYDPRTAQYLSPDPISIDGGIALRNYVPNPTFFIDPMGQGKKPTDPVWPTGTQTPAANPNHIGDQPSGLAPGALRGDQNTLGAGPYATTGTSQTPGFIDCPADELNAAGSDFSDDTRDKIDKAGAAYGCHGCGSKNPLGPDHPQSGQDLKDAQKANHFVPDHQPPAVMHNPRDKSFSTNASQVPAGGVKLFPHCRSCASQQGGQMSALKKQNTPAQMKAMGKTEMAKMAAVKAP